MKKILLISLVLLFAISKMVEGQIKQDTIVNSGKTTEKFDVNIATQKYLDTLTPEQKKSSDAYFEGGYWIQLWDFLLEIVIAWIFLSLGLSGWIKRIAEKTKRVDIQNFIYVILYLLLAYVISFPFAVYKGFFREHQYSLSNMTFIKWFSEEMIQLVLTVVFGGLLITIIYKVSRKLASTWWIWGSGIVVIFMSITLFISPVFISPLFNHYKPLEEGKINDQILSLARGNGVPVNNVYQFDASAQTTRISANVSGFGSTIRVSLNDNLLNRCTPAEIKSVMAHELGHYVLNHTLKLLIYLSIVLIIGFAFINYLMQKAITRFGTKWGIRNISEITTLPLFVLFIAFYMLISTPVTNSIIRSTESEADIFGLNSAGEPDGFASVSMKLSEYRKINPGTLEEIIFFDHPSGKARVSMAMRWKAEHLKSE
jgi:STE24 endopeptidase